jgi:hypothetical protein
VIRAAAEDEAQDEAARDALDALASGFKSLEQSMQIGHLWYAQLRHPKSDSTDTREVPEDFFIALGLLSGTAACLVSGAASLLADGNFYGAAALTRQIVELQYLAWAFENDLDEVKEWYTSTKKDRIEGWTPRRLLKKAGDRFPGKDYGRHCERGGHPTPEGMRDLLYGDVVISSAFGRYEVLTHGYSAWRYAITAVDALCARYGVDPILALPDALDATDAAWDRYSEMEKLSEASRRLLPNQGQP